MSIEGLAPYSPTTIYGQLTSPFTPKKITINSHTPYDKVDEEQENSSEVFSRGYFEGKPQARSVYGKVSTQSAYENDLAKLSEDLASEKVPVEVVSFSSSELSSTDIVKSSLKKGYDTREAIVIQNANSAYQKSAFLTNNPVGVLSTCSYRVF
ncbi:TPA: hypothetical protein CPT92_07575 [Candidatus Gastranaerophilales bacterium HUM_13]|jgi:hypothetical protein|nr:MAG TPA: hypothetical protein CPT92_07575 [Candidatus Gastranaerophilales bacterium HUM_13]